MSILKTAHSYKTPENDTNKLVDSIERMYAANVGMTAKLSVNHDKTNTYGAWSATVGSESARASDVIEAIHALHTKLENALAAKQTEYREALGRLENALSPKT